MSVQPRGTHARIDGAAVVRAQEGNSRWTSRLHADVSTAGLARQARHGHGHGMAGAAGFGSDLWAAVSDWFEVGTSLEPDMLGRVVETVEVVKFFQATRTVWHHYEIDYPRGRKGAREKCYTKQS